MRICGEVIEANLLEYDFCSIYGSNSYSSSHSSLIDWVLGVIDFVKRTLKWVGILLGLISL